MKKSKMKPWFLFSLAFKNLSRYKTRTIITSVVICVGMAIYILLDSIVVGARMDSVKNIERYEMGQNEIMRPQYWEDKDYLPLEHSIENPDEILSALDEAGIEAVPRIKFTADMIVYQDPYPQNGTFPVVITAIDPERDSTLFRLPETVAKGRFIEPGEDGIVIGQWLADDIGADVGYPVTFETRTKDGFYQIIDVMIVGILETPNPMVNRTGIFMPMDTADAYLEMNGAVSLIDLSYPELPGANREARAAAKEIVADTPNVLIPWEELARDFLNATNGDAVGSAVILLLVFIIAAVGISNTMIMTVMERSRELGMMQSLGMRKRDIRRLFILEAAGIGLLGAITGIILSIPFNFYLVNQGLDYSSLMEQKNVGYRFVGIMFGVWRTPPYIYAVIFSVVSAAGSAFFSTWRLLKRGITSCLRG